MAEPTTYIVLRKTKTHDESEAWEFAGRADAPNGEAAIRAALKDLVTGGGTYVAIPARSFRPVNVQAVQTTTIKLEDAGS